MDKTVKKWSLLQIIVAMGIVILGIGLLTHSAATAQGVRDGLVVCGKVLIPSLFPFMVLSSFIACTDFARILSIPLRPITTQVYKLPADLGVVVLLSLIGGYPVGAKMVSLLLEQGRISRETAQRMLCFCVNSGPSFLISAVGVGMFWNHRLGIILFITQTLATLIIGAAVSFRVPHPRSVSLKSQSLSAGQALVSAVGTASSAIIAMCAYAVLFSGLLALIQDCGVVNLLAGILPVKKEILNAALSGFLEVTAGCINSVAVGGEAAVLLVCACVSFCGLSVLFQIMSCFKGMEIRFRPMLIARVAHGFLSCAMTLPLYRIFCQDAAVFLPAYPPVMHTDNRTLWTSICLLAMCSMLLLFVDKHEQ